MANEFESDSIGAIYHQIGLITSLGEGITIIRNYNRIHEEKNWRMA